MNNNTLVQIFSGIRVRGAATREEWERRQHGRLVPLSEAWFESHEDDAMLARYRVTTEDNQVTTAPRLKKRSPLYAELQGRVEATILIGDIDEPDLPKGQNMTPGFLARTQAAIEACAGRIDLHAYCTTRGGFHLLWVFKRPIRPEASEEIYKRLSKQLREHGLHLDPACKDWTRLVRAPDAKRDGVPLSDLPHYVNKVYGGIYSPGAVEVPQEEVVVQPERYKPEAPPENERWKARAVAVLSSLPNCTPRRLEYLEGAVAFGAERWLSNGPASRHQDMLKTVGWAINSLSEAEVEYTSEDVYSLFYLSALASARDTDERHQLDELWRICEWVSTSQRKKSVEETPTREVQLEDIGGDAILRRVALVSTSGGGFFLLREDKKYTPQPAAKEALYNELLEVGMTVHAPTTYVDTRGVQKELSKTAWLNKHALTLHRQVYGTHEGGAIFSEEEGVRSLRVPLYVKTKHTPLMPDDNIMGWFQLISEEVTNGAGFLLHLAHLPTYWRGPCAAMGLLWPTGAGKSLLLDAIRQLVHEGALGGASCYGGFQDHLLKTPYLLIDEGFSRIADRHSISDSFKEYATGGTLVVNPKGRSEICISGVYPRQVFACESQELFSTLLTSSNKSEESLDATNVRLRMYETRSSKLSNYLKEIGGESVTRDWTDPANPLLTRAILWLCMEAETVGDLHAKGRRFGVPEVQDRVLDDILLCSQEASILDHALALMVHGDRDDYWLPQEESFFFRVEEVLGQVKRGTFQRLYSQTKSWTARDLKRELRRMGPNCRRRRPLDRSRGSGYLIAPVKITHAVTGILHEGAKGDEA